MSQEDLAERLDAVERRLDAAYPEPTDGGTDEEAVERLETFAERLADLEAAVEAVEGYVGEIERVDDELEQRADAAIAAAEGAEERIGAVEQRADGFEERLDAMEARTEAAPTADDLATVRSEIAGIEDRLAGTGTEPAASSRGAALGTDPDGSNGAVSDDPTAETTRSEHAPDRSDHRRCDCEVPGGPSDLDGTASAGQATDDRSRDDWKPGVRHGDAWSGREVQRGSQESHAPESSSDRAVSRSNGTRSRPDDGGPSQVGTTAASAPSASSPPGDGSRTAPVGRPDGGQPEARGTVGAASTDPTISGWDDPDATPTSEPPRGSRPTDDGRDDRSWASGGTETLLDRLRSLL